ncbi:hypothetical protein [Methylopila sp. M107]|uniref:hypothetical protein n=1 Tax=Methylopila sp. M107 TaxID=1101190 RepID=UPI0012DFB6BD|nr:hypothetical protein [Methylopila sp. M107]
MAISRCTLVNIALTVAMFSAAAGSASSQPAEEEPIAYIGHGAIFDKSGRQIEPTLEFIKTAQDWYRNKIINDSSGRSAHQIDSFERTISKDLTLSNDEKLVVKQRALEWSVNIAANNSIDRSTISKLKALDRLLQKTLSNDSQSTQGKSKFQPSAELKERLDLAVPPKTAVSDQGTANSGKDYENECIAAGIPIPPPIGILDPAGKAGWKSLGFIPEDKQFIVKTPAELRSYETDEGVCFALPRYSDISLTTVELDGIICIGKKS